MTQLLNESVEIEIEPANEAEGEWRIEWRMTVWSWYSF